jgi:pyruvate,water dikinase
VDAGAIEAPAGIFWLRESELKMILEPLQAGERLESMQARVDERKSSLKARQRLIPPSQLPYSKSYYGIPVEVFVPHEGDQEAGKLKGVGASAGTVTGRAYVLHGPEDFDQMEHGGILVAKMTTPAWTPLFAMAGAVVTDIGGPLSHGSIVAREYGIPAVLGTGAATHVITTGQQITVDGDAGLVILEPGNWPEDIRA